MIDDKLLERLENLSMLKISSDNKDKIKAQLNEILGFIENLESLDLQNINSHQSAHTPLREDVVKVSSVAKSILEHAPKTKDNFFVVPKIIE